MTADFPRAPLTLIDFFGDPVYYASDPWGEPCIAVRPIVETFGIDWFDAHRHIIHHRDAWPYVELFTRTADKDAHFEEVFALYFEDMQTFLLFLHVNNPYRLTPENLDRLDHIYIPHLVRAVEAHWRGAGYDIAPSYKKRLEKLASASNDDPPSKKFEELRRYVQYLRRRIDALETSIKGYHSNEEGRVRYCSNHVHTFKARMPR